MLDYRHCTLCPRACGVDRTAGERGFCQMPDHILAARAALHYWEEPVISGSFGSGAVFFSGCTLRCAFCQNGVISQENFGKEVSSQELRAAFERLIDEEDQWLYGWIIERDPTPPEFETPVMAKLRAFMRAHVAAEVGKGIG